jgi:ATP-dependent DNA ligase
VKWDGFRALVSTEDRLPRAKSARLEHDREGPRAGRPPAIFDVLAIEGESLLSQPYSVRRQRLEELALDGHSCATPAAFEDGAALFAAVCERGLEGVVAKPHRSTYLPAKRTWAKINNRDYWRRESELHAMHRWARATADS